MKKEKVSRPSQDSYDIELREPAEENLANRRILEIMRELNPHKSVKLIKGHHSPHKIIEID